MPEKSVLFVGLSAADLEQIPLPEGVGRTQVGSCTEALDQLLLAPPSLIVANHTIGGEESLEFFTRAMAAGADLSTPIVFVAPPGSGVQPFLYHRRRSGYEVRYLDGSGDVHTYFVDETPKEKDYVLKTFDAAHVKDEIGQLLLADAGTSSEVTEEATEAKLLEVGFNQAIDVNGTRYHVQTEVIAAKPPTVSTTVIKNGRAVHSNRQQIKLKHPTFETLRNEVEKIHLSTAGRVSAGDLK